jgi:hypothetical protein
VRRVIAGGADLPDSQGVWKNARRTPKHQCGGRRLAFNLGAFFNLGDAKDLL